MLKKERSKCRVKMTNTEVDKVDKRDNPHFYWVLMRSHVSTL
jgi:hypothetical protein